MYFTAWKKCDCQDMFSEKGKTYIKKGVLNEVCSGRQLWNFIKNQRRVYTSFEKDIKSGAGQCDIDQLRNDKNDLQRHAITIFAKHCQGVLVHRKQKVITSLTVSLSDKLNFMGRPFTNQGG